MYCVLYLKFMDVFSLVSGRKARFKRRILHAPNRIAELSACKMRRLNQLNATYFNSMRVQSNIRLMQSNIRLKFDS